MKKFIAMLLALAMVLSLAACGAKTEAPAAEAPKAEAKAEAKAESKSATKVSVFWYDEADVYLSTVRAELNTALETAGINYDKLTALPSANLSLTGATGFYLRTGAYFGDAIGPFLEVGPQAKVSANAGITGKEVLFNTNGTVGIGGNVGAEIKIWKFNFGKKGIPFWIKSKKLWDLDLRFSTDDIINAKPK